MGTLGPVTNLVLIDSKQQVFINIIGQAIYFLSENKLNEELEKKNNFYTIEFSYYRIIEYLIRFSVKKDWLWPSKKVLFFYFY